MKKSLILVIVASLVLSVTGTAMAFSVDYNGDIRYQFRSWQDKIGAPDTTTQNRELGRLRLNFSSQINDEATLFGRFGTRTWFGSAGNSGNEGLLDQYGVKVVNNGWTYKLGRQAVNLGQGSIISTGSDVAVDNKFDGVVSTGKIGNLNSSFILGKTTTSIATACLPTNWIGMDLSFNISNNSSMGFAYASEKLIGNNVVPAKTFSAINVKFKPYENLALSGEYVKSNSPSGSNGNDGACFIAGTYSWDKDDFTIQYQSVGVNSVDPYNSGIGAVYYPIWGAGLAKRYNGSTSVDTKYSGFTYNYTHKLNKSTTFVIRYLDFKK